MDRFAVRWEIPLQPPTFLAFPDDYAVRKEQPPMTRPTSPAIVPTLPHRLLDSHLAGA